MTGTRTLFLLAVGIALSVLLLRPVCAEAYPHWQASESPSCCVTADGPQGAKALESSADGFAKPPLSRATSFYLIAAAPLSDTTRALGSAPPPRSFYARSSRILR